MSETRYVGRLTHTRRIAWICCALGVLLLAGGGSFATCDTNVANKVYFCNVVSDFGGGFTDCFRFTSPGNISLRFDLTIDGLGDTLACSCDATGSSTNASFNASNNFQCTTTSAPAGGLGIMFHGKTKGSKLKKGNAVSEFGDSFVFDCVLDVANACLIVGPPPLTSGEPAGGRYANPANR